jgi:hypothetical protein
MITKEEAIRLVIEQYKQYVNWNLPYETTEEFWKNFAEEYDNNENAEAMTFYDRISDFMADSYYDSENPQSLDEAYDILELGSVSDMIDLLYEYYDK